MDSHSKRCLVLGKGVTLVKEALSDLGMTCTPGRFSWRVLWSPRGLPLDSYKQLASYQVVNRLPGSQTLTRKDALVVNIRRMIKRHGRQHFGMIIPQTFLLPGEADRLACAMRTRPHALWITKPTTGSQGKDISIIKSRKTVVAKMDTIVSRYVQPYLIDGRKFDLRLYVAVTSVDPLRVYLFKDGIVRLATEPYTKDPTQLANQFIHLTNVAINRNHPEYDDVNEIGHKRRLSTLWDLLGKEHAGQVQVAIKALVAKTMICVHSVLSASIQHHVPLRRSNQMFELFGFDVLLDHKLHPWLLEVNRCPTLAGSSPIDTDIKKAMLSDLFSLIGIGEPTSGLGASTGRRSAPPSESRSAIFSETDAEYARRRNWERVYPRFEPHPRLSLAQFFDERDARALSFALCNRIPPPIPHSRTLTRDVQSRIHGLRNGGFVSNVNDQALLRTVRRQFGMQYKQQCL
ncbi:Tubulin--tyrosine ligase-like protein 5 [Plasmodiophora brassicae]|nr:hypothetical protein PBRA_007103 [Plasmodiophora brassicae]